MRLAKFFTQYKVQAIGEIFHRRKCSRVWYSASTCIITTSDVTPTCCSFKAQLEKIAGLEREKQQMRDRAYSLEAQLVLKGRAVKEAEGRIEEAELKQKEVCTRTCTCTVLEILRVCSTVHDSKGKFGL